MYFHKNISLYKRSFLFVNMFSFLRDTFSLEFLSVVTHSLLKSTFVRFFTGNPFGVQQDVDTESLSLTVLLFS